MKVTSTSPLFPLVALLLIAACAAAASFVPPLLLADASRDPQVTIAWPTRDGPEVRLLGTRAYQSPGHERPLGRNINVYVGLGGTRLDWGRGHPDAATVRIGIYKRDTRRPLFENIADDAQITIRLDQIYMNQPVIPRPATGLMHVQYMLSDIVGCGLDEDAQDLYSTADKADPLLQNFDPQNTRPGVLAGGGDGRGTITTAVAEDGAVSITWQFPYAILRHLRDPYQRSTPGGFFEPQHFHLELELLAAASPDALPKPKPDAQTDIQPAP